LAAARNAWQILACGKYIAAFAHLCQILFVRKIKNPTKRKIRFCRERQGLKFVIITPQKRANWAYFWNFC
jgi:hypothetical protein